MKKTLVMKFGGTSLADLERVKSAAALVAARHGDGFRVVVVVSAKAGMTDQLIQEAKGLTPRPAPREMDMLVSCGERHNAALMSIAINSLGLKALALTGSQAGIITDDAHTNARIIEIRPFRVAQALEDDAVAVVGGFQGVSFRKEITTLGRGGSDTTAVALACALEAELCEIYSDVDGVYSADPRLVDNPRKLPRVGYQEMQELAEAGAKVLHPQSVEFAKIRKTIIHAKSSLEPHASGTIIQELEGRFKPRVVGVATESAVVLLIWNSSARARRTPWHLLEFCRAQGLRTKEHTFEVGKGGGWAGSLIISEKENVHFSALVEEMQKEFSGSLEILRDCSAISLVGAGISRGYGTLLGSVELLRTAEIPILSLHTSSFRISIIVPKEHLRVAANRLHKRFIEE